MQNLTIKDIHESFHLVMDSSDVAKINKDHGVDFDGFFVDLGNGEFNFIYGFYGHIPYWYKSLYEVKVQY